MQIILIKTDKDNQTALARIEAFWDAQPETAEGDELETLITLVHSFEEDRYPITNTDPIEVIQEQVD